MNIVAVEAHQDDVEICCLGTLLAYQHHLGEQVSITIVSLSGGDKGARYNPNVSSSEITAERNAEARRVAEALGGQYICLNEADEYVQDTPSVRDKLLEVFRAAKADVVLTHPPVDYMEDHITTSRIVSQVAFMTPITTILTPSAPLLRCPLVYFYDAILNLQQPVFFVDITPFFERKVELLKYHKSQLAYMQAFVDADLVSIVETVGRLRGMQSGVRYAEGFCQDTTWPRARAMAMLPLPV